MCGSVSAPPEFVLYCMHTLRNDFRWIMEIGCTEWDTDKQRIQRENRSMDARYAVGEERRNIRGRERKREKKKKRKEKEREINCCKRYYERDT